MDLGSPGRTSRVGNPTRPSGGSRFSVWRCAAGSSRRPHAGTRKTPLGQIRRTRRGPQAVLHEHSGTHREGHCFRGPWSAPSGGETLAAGRSPRRRADRSGVSPDRRSAASFCVTSAVGGAIAGDGSIAARRRSEHRGTRAGRPRLRRRRKLADARLQPGRTRDRRRRRPDRSCFADSHEGNLAGRREDVASERPTGGGSLDGLLQAFRAARGPGNDPPPWPRPRSRCPPKTKSTW